MSRVDAVVAVLEATGTNRVALAGPLHHWLVAHAILGALDEYGRAGKDSDATAALFDGLKRHLDQVSSPDASARADGEGFGTPLAGGDSSAADLSTAAAAEEVPTTPISSPAAPTPGEDAAALEPLPLGSGAAAPIADDDLDGRRLFWCGADGCGDGYNRLGDLQTHALDEHGRYDLTTAEKRRRPRPSAS